MGDGLDSRVAVDDAPDVIVVEEGAEGAITADTVSGFADPPPGAATVVDVDAGGVTPPGDAGDADPYEVMRRQYEARETERDAELARVRAEKEAAVQKARQYSQTAVEHEKYSRDAAAAALDSALAVTERDIAQAEYAMKEAAAGQDWDTFAKAQKIISESAAAAAQIKSRKVQLEGSQPQVKQYEPDDPVEDKIAAFTARSQVWLREHKDDIFKDPKRAKMAEVAHNYATVIKGLTPDTDEYFAVLDEQMGYKVSKTVAPPPPPRAHSAAVPAAPPARNTFGSPTPKTNRVALTKEQRETAIALYSDKPEAEALALYARGILEINSKKSGLLWSKDKYRGGPGV